MHQLNKHNDVTAPADRPGLLAPDTTGMNFYRADPALTDLLRLHLPEPEIPRRVKVPDYAHLLPGPIRRFTTKGVYGEGEDPSAPWI